MFIPCQWITFNINIVFILAFCDIGWDSLHIFSFLCWYHTVMWKYFKVQLKLDLHAFICSVNLLSCALCWEKKKLYIYYIFGFCDTAHSSALLWWNEFSVCMDGDLLFLYSQSNLALSSIISRVTLRQTAATQHRSHRTLQNNHVSFPLLLI